jgi:dynein heavy chain
MNRAIEANHVFQENAELVRADTTSLPWTDYVNYIDNVVLDEFDHFIRKSLNYLTNNMVMDVSCQF